MDANGVRTYVEETGTGPPVLLLHGGLVTAEMLPDLTQALAAKYRVIAPERRGHGRTPDVAGPITYAAMAEDTRALLDAVAIDRADFIGYSDGANVALLTALSYPERVKRLVLVSGNFHTDGMTRAFRLGMRRTRPDDFERSYADAYRRLSPDGEAHWPVIFEKVRRLWLEEPTLSAIEIGRIGAPTFVLAGDRDAVSVEHTVSMFQAIHGARLCIVPGGTHGLLTEQPMLTSHVVLDFLSGVDGS
jgi:pimeloyl-ACP methyl ester carboxylesterase